MIRLRVLPLAGALLFAGACGPAATTEPPAVPAAPTATVAATPAPAAVTAGAMPGDVHFYVELASVPAVLASARAAAGEALFATGRAQIAKELGVPEGLIERFLGAIASAHAGGKRVDGDVKLAVTVAFSDAQPMRDVIASGALVEAGAFGPHGKKLKPKDGGKDTLVWFDAPKLLLVGDEPMTAAVAAVVEGRAPGLSDAQRAVLATANGERRIANAFIAPSLLDDLAKGRVSFPTPLAAALGLWDGGLHGSYRASIAAAGDLQANLPLPPPRALTLARRLPAETVSYAALSTGIPGGRQGAKQLLLQLLAFGGPDAERLVTGVDQGLAETGLRVADLVALLGDEGVVGVVLRPGAKTKSELEHAYAVVIVQEVTDAKQAERLLELARDKLSAAKSKVKLRPEGSGFSADLRKDPLPFLRARLASGKLFVGIGQKDMVERAAAALDKGKGTLGDDAVHAHTLGALPANAQLRLWIDIARAAELAAADARPNDRAVLSGVRDLLRGPKVASSALSFSAFPEADRVRFELDEVNGIGAFAAIGIYGVRRYLVRAKQAEARNTVGAIARAAVAAFERESITPGNVQHQLCKSAEAVPSAVPRGKKYAPSHEPGRDWDAGDIEHGWRCLKFMMTEPHYYQYTYTVGGPYKGPKRGGPDPGPNGFEIAAEGDLDGNGVTSLFTRTGVVDPQTGTVRVSTELWADKEDE